MKQIYKTVGSENSVVSLEDVKAFLRVEHDGDDVTLQLLIASATEEIQEYTSKYLVEQDGEVFLQLPLTKTVEFSRTPIRINGVEAYYAAGSDPTSAQLEDGIDFDFNANTSTLEFLSGAKLVGLRRSNPIVVFATLGYSSADGDVYYMIPAAIKQAVLHRVAECYENREAPVELSPAIKRMVHPYKRIFV